MTHQLCKLFVGRLSASTDDDGLRMHFEQFGTLADCVVVVNKPLKRSRCFGFVSYSTPEEADAAIAARPHVVDGRTVELKRAVAREDSNKPEVVAKVKNIFVGGLKDDIEEDNLTEYFSQFGKIERSKVISQRETGKRRGFGFVHFVDTDSADKAVALKFHYVKGHKVEVKKALTKELMQSANRVGMMRGVMGQNRFGGGRGECSSYGGNGRGYGDGYIGGYGDQMGGYGYTDFGSGYSQQPSGYGPMKGPAPGYGAQRSAAPYAFGGGGGGYQRGAYGGGYYTPISQPRPYLHPIHLNAETWTLSPFNPQ
ncbi:heterogeneous nuclear ribonucleoprotein A0-like [Lampris incognitus]|uniref:heterogeneous nuclear ribonucleoprotein A0-like n=1 Tax=Lampris incognitus TaxID=2546036 RepID=UPI0024B5ADB2|nr:heterogeneous nuclear ribonucleoprotein A0-like [Lampris incognitus]